MLTRSLYYRLKPFMPSRFRLALRRLRVRRILGKSAGYWPIHEGSGRTPEGWPGWPDGKQFAFVLSHDVEGARGLSRCRQLAEIEMEYGFRSSFNFIPKGEYDAPQELLEWLRRNGFEIGVHDLFHDGNLFRSKQSFARHAEAINHQLAAWGAVGFRAGFMLHELDWLHALNLEYDSSTFDVDPFEPQADGVETIFPFWIPEPDPKVDAPACEGSAPGGGGNKERGYVEMPYTLVQDYNLFVVLQQSTTQMWERKLEWIARHGGMAFLNTHPDYMAFGGGHPGTYEFPVEHYAGFLRRVSQGYGGSYFHDLPRVVARHVRKIQAPQARSPRQVCMVVYNGYEHDNRVRRYAETLARRGDRVSVYSRASPAHPVGADELNGVHVFRLFQPRSDRHGKLDYILDYSRFWWRAFRMMQARHFPRGCDLVHVHNMPEALVFAAVCLKWNGAKVILDLHDLMPELYQDKFHISERHLVSRILRAIESWACRFSHHVIISNHLWKKVVAQRSRVDGNLTALINHVDLRTFHPRRRERDDGKFVILYPGSLNHHQGLDIAIEAMVEIRKAVPTAELHIYGEGPQVPILGLQANTLGLADSVFLKRGVPLSQVGGIMANADLGVVPKRADGFGNEAFSTKIMEFMSQGLPVVVSRTKVDSFYFNDENVCFFESGNPKDLALRIIALAQDPAWRSRLVANAAHLVKNSSWEVAQPIYLDIVDRLTRTRRPELKSPLPEANGLLQP